MYKDFDEFVQIIDSSTQYLVRKIATGYDATEKIKQKRQEIEQIGSHAEFLIFLNHCLPFTMAAHAKMAEDYHGYFGVKYIDTQIVQPLYQAYNKYVNNLSPDFMRVGIGDGFYHKGNYYVYGKHRFINRNTSDTTVISDFRLLKHNEKPVSVLTDEQIKESNPHWLRWDYQLRQYYNVFGLRVPRTDRILVENYPTKNIIDLDMKDCIRRFNSFSLPDSIQDTLSFTISDEMKIKYYDSLHLLYIYMGVMSDDGGAFANSIKEAGRGQKIDKVIIDIRNNYGGDDRAWNYVLQAIVKKPVPVKGLIGFRNTGVMRNILEDIAEQHKTSPERILKQKISFLDNAEFLILLSGGVTEEGDTLSLVPDSNSLQYDGNIYILQNEFVSSSAAVLVANTWDIPQFISVGIPTGLISGRGVSPAIFQLPESKFTFVMEADVDLTNAKTAFDVFHDRPEIEIYPTIDEIIEMNNYGSYLNKRGDKFLFEHDYLFKKVLEME
jgi:hypothetical protein